MSKQEEIKETIFAEMEHALEAGEDETKIALAERYTDEILIYLNFRGVVLKVDRETPYCSAFTKKGQWCLYIEAGYVAVEPLI